MGENYFGITDVGRQRTNNEDSFIAKSILNDRFILACVIDGVGGYTGGEIAAQITSDEIIRTVNNPTNNFIDQLKLALENANKKILSEKALDPQYEKMACVVTLTVVDIEKNVFYFAHVGDTRLYLYRDGSLIKVTKDHSNVGFLEESGRITEEAAMLHPKRNEVNKVLGYETQLPLPNDFIDTGESPFLPGDSMLICSDGLTDMITSTKIIAILNTNNNLKNKGELLVSAANHAGGKDNISVVLVHNNKLPLQQNGIKPAVAQKKIEILNSETVQINNAPFSNDETGILKPVKNSINKILLAITMLALGGFAWMLFKEFNDKKEIKPILPAVLPQQKSLQELGVFDTTNKSSIPTIQLSSLQQIPITGVIMISSDSLHIVGNGASFICDSSYKGPAFILAKNCKYILFDSINITNFGIGINVNNKGLVLNKVRFKNCDVSIQFLHQSPLDSFVSGKQTDAFLYHKDSVHKKLR